MTKSLDFLNKMEVAMSSENKRKPGRPVVEGSARQLKLAAQAARAESNGGAAKRGRPVVTDSARQLKLAARAAAIAAGVEIKRGRPKMQKEEVMADLAALEI